MELEYFSSPSPPPPSFLLPSLPANESIQDISLPQPLAKPPLIPLDFLDTFVFINYVILSTVICFLGIIFNIVNAIVFYRMGFNDTVNISLFSLALSDTGVLMPLLWRSILFNPDFWEKMPFEHLTIQYYSGGWPQGCLANISSLIMVYVTLDRCLCIAMPLKVRSIITPRRTIIIILCFAVLMVCSLIPLYSILDFGPIFFPHRNKTLVGLRYSAKAQYVEDSTFSFYVFMQVFTSSTVTIFSAILIIFLRRQAAWRLKAANSKDSSTSVRDTKIVKMILFIALLFLSVYIPSTTSVLVMIFNDDFGFTGRYINLVTLIWALVALLSATNSTVNIFVYLNMSTKYNNMFKSMFSQFNVFAKDSEGKETTNGDSSKTKT